MAQPSRLLTEEGPETGVSAGVVNTESEQLAGGCRRTLLTIQPKVKPIAAAASIATGRLESAVVTGISCSVLDDMLGDGPESLSIVISCYRGYFFRLRARPSG